jgi:hypothetical protein
MIVVESSLNNGYSWIGTWLQDINQYSVYGIPVPTGSIGATGNWALYNLPGITHVRARAATMTGTASVTLTASETPPVTAFGAQAIVQDVLSSAANSSTANLGPGATFTGGATSTLNINAIQVALKTDQNCLVYVDQSNDGIYWDISDTYQFYATLGNFGITVQAIGAYARVRVVNQNATTGTAYFRLGTVLCPIVEALPRSLDEYGYLQVALKGNTDSYGFDAEYTPNGEQRVVEPMRLIGAEFEGNTLDPNFWLSSSSVAPSSIVQSNSELVLTTGTAINANTSVYSTRRARYVAGSAMRYRTNVQMPEVGLANSKRRFGVGWPSGSLTDGAYFQMDGTTFGVATRKGGVESPIVSGAFNGDLGSTYTPLMISGTGSVGTYEIYWNSTKVWFTIENIVLHTVSFPVTTWANTLQFHAFADTYNSAVIGSSLTTRIRNMSISRLGKFETAPIYKNLSTGTGVVLKYGPGHLRKVIVNSLTNGGGFILYDAAGAGITIATVVMAAANGATQQYDFDLDFYTALAISITGTCNVTVVYE